ncbi:ATPase H(+)-transporting accessory protein 2 [Musca vetustissima]|uniref:ATPase H(+)-transporting accessory protein 2 n=1 Tax=Musca vetustissima TaxID=27455 RepID=UPI002AB7486F|nr:ATPase H(+)-transporting accessory protein 2 [Musca vetustissima]
MLRNLLILSLCIVAIKASGEFTVLSTPKSLSFKGNEPLQSQYVGDVVYASLGNAVAGDAQWSGLTIADPFNLPKVVVAATLTGVAHTKVSGAGKSYEIQGNSVKEALNGVSAQLEADNEAVCDLDFDDLEEGVANFKSLFGDVEVAAVENTKYLNSELHSADKQFVQAIAYINAAADNLAKLQKSCNFVSIRLSADSVAKAHGEKSEAINEALDLFTSAVKNLNTAAQKVNNNGALVLSIVNKSENSRAKRDVPQPDVDYNLAEYYNEDYPVIFNIILWFMVTFGFALLAICYAIGSMDPGRDSIIYRMTSTRMKKDN